MDATLTLAATLLADWGREGTPPRDALPARPELRGQPAAVRGAAVGLANAAIAGARRLAFLLGDEAAATELPPVAKGRLLALAAAVEAGRLSPTAAAAAAGPGRAWDFAAVANGGPVLARIADPAHRFAVRHSLPDWLAARCLAEFGAAADAVLEALAVPPPRTLRANLLKIADRRALAEALRAEGIDSELTRWSPHGLHVLGHADLYATAAARAGAFAQQDEASQLAALAVAPPPRGAVLDLCAGAGGKTLALAAALGNRGEVLATDVHEGRLRELRERARAAGASNVRAVVVPDGSAPWPEPVAAFAARADRILVDAPCSGTGSWRRRPEARWRLRPPDLRALEAQQQDLLDRAAAALRPGARLVYATCSLFAAENGRAVEALRTRRPDLEPVRLAEVLGGAAAAPIADATGTFLQLRPDQHGCDGFFAAILRKRR